ncbi:hypothetical protein QM012_004293 [Aureobasidium pullulans]|uniref:C2H2-type domain-containing protein n=1 Tax=Aureobasidium pullulans TaxID=5580 RepID=A0ABR0TTC7_AURPU
MSFPCATCGTTLSGNTFEYQKHMTRCHWTGKDNSLPLPSIITPSITFDATPLTAQPVTYSCYFCTVKFYNPGLTASHMITSHGSDLHSILCPKAGNDSIRESVSAFLNEFAASSALFVSLCDCFPDHPSHTLDIRTSVDDSDVAYDSGLGAPMSGVTPTTYGERVYLRPCRP